MSELCFKCGGKAIPGAETYTGKPACYIHEDKISYLERMALVDREDGLAIPSTVSPNDPTWR